MVSSYNTPYKRKDVPFEILEKYFSLTLNSALLFLSFMIFFFFFFFLHYLINQKQHQIMSNFDRAEWPPAQMIVVRLEENARKILPRTVLLCFSA